MWLMFRIEMFITSFIPLWISIAFMDCWDIVSAFYKKWNCNISFGRNFLICSRECIVQLVSALLILLIVGISCIGLNTFLKARSQSKNRPKGTIQKATNANKLSSEFLLAYILPMIAFDFGKIRSVIIFLFYFLVLAYLCVRNNNMYANIFLEFKGYRMYMCDIAINLQGKEQIYRDSLVISALNDLTQMVGNDISYWDFEKNIYIQIDEEKVK